MQQQSERDILTVLKRELECIETGQYGPPVKDPVDGTSTMFEDSETCLNYGYPYRVHSCSECPLIGFVPKEKQTSAMPCHEIPLDEAGRTVEGFAQGKDASDLQEAVKGWLRNAIRQLESAQPQQGSKASVG